MVSYHLPLLLAKAGNTSHAMLAHLQGLSGCFDPCREITVEGLRGKMSFDMSSWHDGDILGAKNGAITLGSEGEAQLHIHILFQNQLKEMSSSPTW